MIFFPETAMLTTGSLRIKYKTRKRYREKQADTNPIICTAVKNNLSV